MLGVSINYSGNIIAATSYGGNSPILFPGLVWVYYYNGSSWIHKQTISDPNPRTRGYFGHLMGYDAGYYGYAWADAISADMATVFENAPNRFYDKKAGMRLRKEIYEIGDSRDVNVSIEKFLGRTRSLEPFLKDLGINK